jgi:hypothetical protein
VVGVWQVVPLGQGGGDAPAGGGETAERAVPQVLDIDVRGNLGKSRTRAVIDVDAGVGVGQVDGAGAEPAKGVGVQPVELLQRG